MHSAIARAVRGPAAERSDPNSREIRDPIAYPKRSGRVGWRMTYSLGVDLGTTYTAAAIRRHDRTDQRESDRLEIVDLGTRIAAIPSVVYLRDDGAVLTGEAAVRRGATDPGRLAREFKLTHDEIAHRVGKDRPTISNALRLLRLPEFVLAAVRDGRLSAGHARALVPLADSHDELRGLVARAIAEQLSVRAIEKAVQQITATPKAVRQVERERRERTLDHVARLLTESLQTQVLVRARADGGGQIVLSYGNNEELDRLVQALRSRA